MKKKYSSVLLFLFSLVALHVTAQPGFQKMYGGVNQDRGFASVAVFDGIFLLGAATSAGPAVIIPGDSVLLTASSGSGYTYSWSTHSTSQSIYATESGKYEVTVTNASGCTSGANVTVSYAALPINLLDFCATKQKQSVIISWTTNAEVNNDFFTVEKSEDGHNWLDIEKIPGAGNATSQIHYSIVDENPYTGIKYYRLIQTDGNGFLKISRPLVYMYSENDKTLRIEA